MRILSRRSRWGQRICKFFQFNGQDEGPAVGTPGTPVQVSLECGADGGAWTIGGAPVNQLECQSSELRKEKQEISVPVCSQCDPNLPTQVRLRAGNKDFDPRVVTQDPNCGCLRQPITCTPNDATQFPEVEVSAHVSSPFFSVQHGHFRHAARKCGRTADIATHLQHECPVGARNCPRACHQPNRVRLYYESIVLSSRLFCKTGQSSRYVSENNKRSSHDKAKVDDNGHLPPQLVLVRKTGNPRGGVSRGKLLEPLS